MSKICLEDVNMDVDYEDIAFIESTFMHDMKRLGKEGCVRKYIDEVPKLSFGSDNAYNYMVCLLRYFGKPLGIDIPYELKPVDKWVLDECEFDGLDFYDKDEIDEFLSKDSIKEFRDAKIVVYNFEGYAYA